MSLAAPEDAASLLEQFMHDVANTPAEVSHLLEEIQAKDLQIQTFKDEITKRDVQLQRHVRMQGGHVNNPKEETFNKTIADCFDKCDILQAEKCGLSEKALIVLERHVKRLDVGLRNLSLREEFPADWNGPSMLSASGNVTGVSTPIAAAVGGGPLQSMSGNVGTSGGAANIANAAQMRMAQAGGLKGSASPTSQTPTNAPRNQREGSSEANKRRRLNASLGSLPAASSNLRQSSLGPGTPTGGTPSANGPSTSRQGSAQPPRPSAQSQKKAPAGSTNANAASSSKKVAPPHPSRKRDRHRTSTSATTTTKKGDRRRQLTASTRSTPGTAGGADSTSPSPSPTPSALARNQNDGSTTTPDPPGPHAHAHNLAPGTAPNPKGSRSPHPPHSHDTKTSKRASASPSASPSASDDDDDDEEEEADDNNLYCFCQRRSFGPMVGCDNDNCEYQWFHYGCVGIEVEPTGEWLCPSCRKLPGWKVEKGGSQ